MATQEQIKRIRDFAIQHYGKGGWDIVVECYEDSDIAREIDECGGRVRRAISNIARDVGNHRAYEDDIKGEAF